MRALTWLWTLLGWLSLGALIVLLVVLETRFHLWEVQRFFYLLTAGTALSLLALAGQAITRWWVRRRERGEEAPRWRRRLLMVTRALVGALPVVWGVAWALIVSPRVQDFSAWMTRLIYLWWVQ